MSNSEKEFRVSTSGATDREGHLGDASSDEGGCGAFRWCPSSPLDRICLRLHEAAKNHLRLIVIAAVSVVVLTNISVAFAGMFINPIVGAFTFISLLPALFVAVYVRESNPSDSTVGVALLFTYLLGVMATGLAYVLNTAASGYFTAAPVLGTALFFFLFVGPVEEGLKLSAAYLSAYDSRLFRGAADGAAYGAFAALGFVTAENALYIVGDGFLTSSPFLGTIVGRAGVGPAHVIWSAVAGYYLGLAKTTPNYTGPVVLKGFLVAAFLHATYNTFVTYHATVVESIGVLPEASSMVLNAVFLLSFYAGVWYYLELLVRRYRRAYAEDGLPVPEKEKKDSDGSSPVTSTAVASLLSVLRQ
jgi:RsiW-degrading membrane proteinase PrsW (M82 family)